MDIDGQGYLWELTAVLDMQWSPNSVYLAIVTAGSQVRVLNQSLQTILVYEVPANQSLLPLTSAFVDWSSDSSMLAVGVGRRVLLWDVPTFTLRTELIPAETQDFIDTEFIQGPNYFTSLQFSFSNNQLLATLAEARMIIWNLDTLTEQVNFIYGNNPNPYAWRPNYPTHVYGVGNRIINVVDQSRVPNQVMQPTDGSESFVGIPIHMEQSTGGLLTARGGWAGNIEIVDSITLQALAYFYMFPTEPGYEYQRVPIRDMSWSSDDRYLAVITDNRVLWLIDLVENERRPVALYPSVPEWMKQLRSQV